MSSFPVKDSEYYPKIRIHKESLIRGCIVLYKPDLEHQYFDPTVDDSELPWGSIGIYLELDIGWENFVPGHEPVSVLFGPTGITRVYMDELEVLS